MQAVPLPHRVSPSDWLITSGAQVVGPVPTGLFLRGVAHGRVPDYCRAKQPTWRGYRALREIREVQGLERYQRLMGPLWRPEPDFQLPSAREDARLRASAELLSAEDLGETLLVALSFVAELTKSEVGLLHRFREPYIGMVTSYVRGERLWHQLGEVLKPSDPAVVSACQRRPVIGSAFAQAAQIAVARRLGAFRSDGRLGGVAMLPIFGGRRLLGMVELGRTGRGFRAADKAALEGVGEALTERLGAFV